MLAKPRHVHLPKYGSEWFIYRKRSRFGELNLGNEEKKKIGLSEYEEEEKGGEEYLSLPNLGKRII